MADPIEPRAILRYAKPLPPEGHKCVVYHGEPAHRGDRGAIIQCQCGRRYKCRQGLFISDSWTWVRRILPWPGKVKP